MRSICIFFALFVFIYCLNDNDLVVTRDYVDYLKRHVDWEVMDYEDNIFRGWTIGEARSILGLIDMDTELEGAPQIEIIENLPTSLSWKAGKCDQAVKNQQSCGACYAFAAANMLASRCCLMSRDRGWLSVQELIDCDKNSRGCEGGSLTGPVKYIQTSKGLVTDSCYPYKQKKQSCPTKCANGASFSSSRVCACSNVANCQRTAGIKSCLTTGPVPIGFSVCQSFYSYKSGTYKCDCSKFVGGHAVVAVGYSDAGGCKFNAKNSWGATWGNRGYFDIACETCSLSGGSVCKTVK